MANIPSTASRLLFPGESVVCNEPDYAIVAGSFETVNDADVTNVVGSGFQVNRTGEGTFDVTFANLYPGVISVCTGLTDTSGGSNDDAVVTVEPYSSADGTMLIKVSKESAGALVPNDVPGARVNFVVVFHRRDALNVIRTA